MARDKDPQSPAFPGAKRLRKLGRWTRLQRLAARKFFLQRLHSAPGESRPVFLVGNVRSGTSMIVFQLANSWQVDLYNEDDPAAFEDWRLKKLDVIAGLVSNSRAPVTLFKPILDTHRAHELMARFPESRLIFAYRHFDDVVNSARRRFYRPDGSFDPSRLYPPRDPRDPTTRWMQTDFAEFDQAPPPEETRAAVRTLWKEDLNLESRIALRWLFINRLYFDLGLDRLARVLLVCYEEIVAAPEREFQRICRFLGLDFEAQVTHGVFSSSIGRNRAPEIDPPIRAACEQMAGRLDAVLEAEREASGG
jgi:hypothetical protein